jgi:hypothetical protein
MDLSLSEEERELLQDVLSSTYRDLRMEIANTDNMEYRQLLRSRQAALEALLERVGGLLDAPKRS